MREKPRILVIDDEKDICDLFEKVLTEEGYTVLTALSGLRAIEIALENKPDLVLLDLRMPEMDGIEVLRRLKKIDKNIVIIMITAYGTMETARMAMKIGAYDYITKPFDLDYVKTVIKDGLKVSLYALTDQMKEKKLLLERRTQRASLDRLKHCHPQEPEACFWEVALKAFVLGDEHLLFDWMENPKVSREEKMGLTKIAQIFKADMTKQ